jgi:hypothetical protein
MSWWIIGLALWLCPALVVGVALLRTARRRQSARKEETVGFWWDAQGKLWNPADTEAAAHSLVGPVLERLDEQVSWPTPEVNAPAASASPFRPLLPSLLPTSVPAGQ